MKLSFLGTGAAYYPVLGSTSAYFVKKSCLYLIDCGETTFSRVFGMPVLRECDRVSVLITHLHADHIGSLGSFISYCKNVLGKEIAICYPDSALEAVLALMGLTDQDYRYCMDFGRSFDENLRITPILVRHDSSMGCYGYFLEDENEVVYYGGDSCGMPEGLLNQLQSGAVTRMYQEVTYEKHRSPSHTSLEQLCEIVPRCLREKVVCMHFGDDYVRRVQQLGFMVAVEGQPI